MLSPKRDGLIASYPDPKRLLLRLCDVGAVRSTRTVELQPGSPLLRKINDVLENP